MNLPGFVRLPSDETAGNRLAEIDLQEPTSESPVVCLNCQQDLTKIKPLKNDPNLATLQSLAKLKTSTSETQPQSATERVATNIVEQVCMVFDLIDLVLTTD